MKKSKVQVSFLFKHQHTPMHALIDATAAIEWQEGFAIPRMFLSYSTATDEKPTVVFLIDPTEIAAIQFVEVV